MKKLLFSVLAFLFITKSFALIITVTNPANDGFDTLRKALASVASGDTIEFSLGAGSTTINLDPSFPPLPTITVDLTINGTNAAGTVTINGQTQTPCFIITGGTVDISNLNILNCSSRDGVGGIGQLDGGGGGGMGAGGGILIDTGATVTLNDLNFDGCSARGGDGGDGKAFGVGFVGGGGGGGLGGKGASNTAQGGGGGGGFYSDASGQTPGTGGGRGGKNIDGESGFDATADFGGGGGSGNVVAGTGGDGLFAGGGGGGGSGSGGNGGFGGGGGGGGGSGGINESGGTGGGTVPDKGGNGGTSNGATTSGGGGGGGAGFGGAVFLRTGGSLSFNSDITSNQSATGGASGSGGIGDAENGANAGDGLYLMSTTTLILNPSASDEKFIAAQISGPGAVTKNGSGTFTLSATNNYLGLTSVNAGTLIVNGSIATSTTTVNPAATLKGVGSVGSLTVNGILGPGNSIGTITVVGPYIQNSGSTLAIEIDSLGNASKVDITGAATINNSATLAVTVQAGNYETDQIYTVLDAAGGRSGEFSPFTIVNPAQLDGGTLEVSYTSNLVQLLFTANTTLGPTAISTNFFSNNLINQVNHLQSNLLFDQSILRFYQKLCPCHKKGGKPFFLANYLHGHSKTSSYIQGGAFSLSGTLVGFDYWTQNDLVFGSFFNYLRAWADSDNKTAKVSSNNYAIGAYIQKLWDRFFLEGEVSGTITNFEIDRFSNNTKINNGSPDGYAISLQTRGVKSFEYKNFLLLPNLGLRYFYNHIDAYFEKKQITNRLDITSQKNNVLEVLLGTIFSYNYLVSFGAIIPQIELTYIADTLREKTSFDSKFVGSAIVRNIKIKANPENTLRLGTSIDFRFVNCSILNVAYVASFATNQRISNEVHLAYKIDF